MIQVIKLGGSLLSGGGLRSCLQSLNHERGLVVVPGGGPFADQIRRAQQQLFFDERTAHRMAILAMQQMALLLAALQPTWRLFSSVNDIVNETDCGISIWSPCLSELDQTGIHSSWDVTSDSLSAWLATRIGASRLILVKSADIPDDASIEELQKLKIVDSAFHTFIESPGFSISIQNYQRLEL